ncbi:MAG: pilus assembly protein PilM [Candidatus Omnitrophica bacterium]|nr:pilus assembly protein PilM [Candidatus Omnitrophota bacterium]
MPKFKMPAKSHQRLFTEIGPGGTKWVLTKGSSHSPEVVDAGFIPSEAPAGELQAIIKKYKLGPEDVASAIPRRQVTARNLELPSTQPAEIKKIIDLQAVKQTPYAATEILYDYHILKSFREGYSSVLLVVAHRDVLNNHLKILNEAGLKPPQVTIGAEASALWAVRHLKTPKPDDAVVFLDVDTQHTDLIVLHGRELVFSQNISVGTEKLEAEGEAGLEKWMDEVSRSMHIYRTEEIAKEPVFLLAGGATAAIKPAFERLKTVTGLADVKELPVWEPLIKIFKARGKDYEKHLSFSSVSGLAHQDKILPINLVPEETLLKESLLEKGRNLLWTGILALSIFLVVSGIFATKVYRKTQYLKWLENRVASTQDTANQVESMKKRIKDGLALHDAGMRFFDEIIHVHRILPKEIYLTEISVARDERLQIQGRAETMTSVFDFVNNLKSNALFREVETKRINKRMVDNKEIVDFEIESRLADGPTRITAPLQTQLTPMP